MNYFYALILLTWVGCFTPMQAQNQFTVQGKVIDAATDEPLPGVNILVKGTTTGTVTDIDGNYRLTAPDDTETLVFSSVGYISEEVAISNQTVINLEMTPDTQSLSEVVVVGYGTQERADVTGAIGSVQSEEITNIPITTLEQGLQGQVAGVQVTQADATPGGGVTIRVRGGSSLSAGNEPLYVVDGYPILGDNINFLNPNDIKSIDILKDASATAIYGSRGSNGVVIITTKRGSSGAPKVTFNSYYGVQQVRKRINLLECAILRTPHTGGRD